MTTMLALMMVAQTGAAGVGDIYSREIEARYWLVGQAHGMWEGRRAGPYSADDTNEIVEQQRNRRLGMSAAMPEDLGQLSQVLRASDSELAKLLRSDDPLLVRNAIAEAALRRAKAAVPALYGLAIPASYGEKRGASREEPIPALAMIGGADAITHLRELLGDRNQLVAIFAAYGLAAHGLKDGTAQLWYGVRHPIVKSFQITKTIRRNASMALVRLGEVTNRSELDEVFRLTHADGRYLCPLLAKSGKPAQLAKLRDLVVDATADHLVRKWAAIALGDIRDRAAAANLKRALTDPSRQVREAAQAALQKIGS